VSWWATATASNLRCAESARWNCEISMAHRLDDLDARGPVTSFRESAPAGWPMKPGPCTGRPTWPLPCATRARTTWACRRWVFKSIYRGLHALAGCTAERAFLPEMWLKCTGFPRIFAPTNPVVRFGDFSVVAFSLASELELAGVVTCLDLARIPALRSERAAHTRTFPLVVLVGPLTFSNPVPGWPVCRRHRHGRSRGASADLGERLARTT